MDDFDAAITRLKGSGCTFQLEPWETPVCHMAMAVVCDPDGNSVMIHRRKAGWERWRLHCFTLGTTVSEDGRGELGIELAPQFWCCYGYAIEVMGALVEFGFHDLKLREIYGGTVSANARIARLLSSFGAASVTQAAPAWMIDR